MHKRRVLELLAAVVLAAASWSSGAADTPDKTRPEQQKTQTKLDAVRAHIKTLTEQQQHAGEQRDELSRQLVEQATALRKAADAVRDTEQKQAAFTDQLTQLRQQEDHIQAKLDKQHDALAALLRATYMLGHGSDLRMLLGQVSDCAQPQPATKAAGDADCAPGDEALTRIQRALAYSQYFQQDRMTRIKALLADLDERQQVRDQIATQQQVLADSAREYAQNLITLKAAREQQQQLLARVEADIQKRHASLETLKQDEKSLETLLRNLRDMFADIPKEMTEDKPFKSQRGHLPWPLAGSVKTQKLGILIGAKPGTRVHAVGHGRVAYAAWLRGYGMLLIIDHGDGWMSLYGGNENLLRSVGDWVNRGDVIATSGSGEAGEPGLYFGLRHSGQPVSPRPWLSTR